MEQVQVWHEIAKYETRPEVILQESPLHVEYPGQTQSPEGSGPLDDEGHAN